MWLQPGNKLLQYFIEEDKEGEGEEVEEGEEEII